ncbi:hypothetical protein [Nocardia amikacinitolerans]|uniref:hypothetical protein n=1 Tax=Nocardia amikacinitolerans TaxID=756689 RepID=UPI000830F07C|nr:hypothetical protein [Nocardia amikacinitolerans]MCP2281046.1 hypothetical protein [Nocardia amikacinitolerans]MCP2300069.1 hypothetical protein [Nocardia amikacinitolerans]MCP2320207.1 hypothetical protein [Nocardia amikacinitolerans]
MPKYVFHLQVKEHQLDRLQRLNEEYRDDFERVVPVIPGLRGIEKYLVGTDYVELIDYDGSFADFGAAMAADPALRKFMRSVNDCFTTPLREMTTRQMATIQTLP